MAYTLREHGTKEGPYPNLPDEFCGNCSQDQYKFGENGTFWNKRIGRPHPTEKHTTKQLEEIGVVGLYLKIAISLPPKFRNPKVIPTPKELMEPLS